MVASAALAATFVPSRATTPSFTRPASWHISTSTKSFERLLVLRPKATDGTEVWLLVGRHHPETYIFLESAGYAPLQTQGVQQVATIIPGS